MPRPRVTFSRNGHDVVGPLGAAEGHQQQGVVRRGVRLDRSHGEESLGHGLIVATTAVSRVGRVP